VRSGLVAWARVTAKNAWASSGPMVAALSSRPKAVPSPRAVGGVAPLQQEAQPYDVAGQPGHQHPAAEVVAGLVGPATERLLLGDPPPLAGELPQPQVARVPGQHLPDRLQLAQPVVVDGPAVTEARVCCGVTSQSLAELPARGSNPSSPVR